MRRTATRLVIAGVLAVQVAVPALALRHERPAAFGWHMYAAAGDLPAVEIVDRGGRVHQVDERRALAHFRPELDYRAPLARFFCRRPGAVTAVVRDAGTGRVELTRRC